MYGRKLKKKLSRGTSNSSASTSKWGPRAALEAQAEQDSKVYTSKPPAIFKNPYAQVPTANQVLYESKLGKSSQVKKPLTVIIPNQKDGRYDYAYNNRKQDNERRHHSYDSLPSTETWRSSDSEPDERQTDENLRKKKNRLKLSQKLSLPKESEIIEVRVPTSRALESKGVDYTEHHLDLGSECSLYSENNSGKGVTVKEQVKGQPINFALQMVYVPMEQQLDDRKNKAFSTEVRSNLSQDARIPLNLNELKDPDGDSLLESFDSVIFKPNLSSNPVADSPGTSSGVDSTSTSTNKQPDSFVFKSDSSKKNIRFADTSSVSIKKGESFCKCRRDNSSHSNTLLLDCGHTKQLDTYSTLSSDEYDFHTSHSARAEKSALQQLRDLSILIGGNFHKPLSSPSPNGSAAQTKLSPTDNVRKTSTTTATSADSGKGSAPTQSSNSSPPVEEDENSCIFRPDCQECVASAYTFNQLTPNFESLPKYEAKKPKIVSRKTKFMKNTKTKPKANRLTRPVVPSTECHDNVSCDCNCACPLSKKAENLIEPKSNFRLSNNSTNQQVRQSESTRLTKNLLPIVEEDEDNENFKPNSSRSRDTVRFEHPKSWRSPDPALGWSDLESLYSANFKSSSPLDIDGECWKCWREMSEFKKSQITNTTLERTKRMFIWLNRRPKEFSAPWWEAKKEASIKWLLTKAFKNLPPDSPQLCGFRESKKDRLRLRLKDEVIRDLTNGKLYTLALLNLYSQPNPAPNSEPAPAQNPFLQLKPGDKLSLWEIIKVLCRNGVYVAQPSDIKLTEGTLRQRRPIKIAAHIALIEAMMSLYAAELVNRQRLLMILNSFGHVLGQEVHTPEVMLITWINSVITVVKTYILTSTQINSTHSNFQPVAPYVPPSPHALRWLHLPQATDLRDLCDGVGICALFALYFSNDIRLDDVAIPEQGDMLSVYDMTKNHSLIQKFCLTFFPEKIYHLQISDFLYIHGYMKLNILAFLTDLFMNLEVNPIVRVNRLTQNGSLLHL